MSDHKTIDIIFKDFICEKPKYFFFCLLLDISKSLFLFHIMRNVAYNTYNAQYNKCTQHITSALMCVKLLLNTHRVLKIKYVLSNCE